MASTFGVFVPQGRRLDLVGIDDPVAQFAAMTAIAGAVNDDPRATYDHTPLAQCAREAIPQFA